MEKTPVFCAVRRKHRRMFSPPCREKGIAPSKTNSPVPCKREPGCLFYTWEDASCFAAGSDDEDGDVQVVFVSLRRKRRITICPSDRRTGIRAVSYTHLDVYKRQELY